MKKQLFILTVALLPLFSKAQSTVDNFQLGFTTSPNIAWFSVDDNRNGVSNDGVRTGFSYGVLADLGFARNYYFSTGFTLTSVNGKTSRTEGGNTYYSDVYKIRYIDVPLTLKLKSNPNQMGRFYGQFGLGMGVKTSAKGTSSSKLLGETPVETDNARIDDVNTFRLSLVAGAGAEWAVKDNLSILTGLTYNNGFTKVVSGNPGMKNSYLALTLGVFF
ncbi:porin family protein [Arcticibacter sp. MXS-1]|uniref:porin family protein n=1 Tax=Arcticibacter sp. MXS-1 TaxID=3341726 RepID=UPI0035A92B9D